MGSKLYQWLPRLLVVLLMLQMFGPLPAQAAVDIAVSNVPPAADFVADAQQAAREGIPILVVVTRDGCSFCATIKRTILIPMLRSGNYQHRVIIRELNVDWQAQVTDFSGQRRSAESLAAQYGASFVPTVLLLDPGGREATDRLVGINTEEMYGWYLDKAIATATKTIQGKPDG